MQADFYYRTKSHHTGGHYFNYLSYLKSTNPFIEYQNHNGLPDFTITLPHVISVEKF
uniref:Uncharacterized protein n=1 Tax=Anguilla anguilla TaxID=7936 RepID=A0A0E9SX30_ANGAN